MRFPIYLSAFVLMALTGCSQGNTQANASEEEITVRTEPECVPHSEINHSDGIAFYNNSPFSGKVCSYRSDGKLHTMTTYSEGKKEGMWEVYYADGQREKSGFTRKGKDDGLYREWYPNGQLKYEYHYDLGRKVDVWKSWYEDGTPYTERHFKNDQLHGKVLVWDERGKLAKEYDYVDGRLMNSQMHFKEEGF
jgi:antitoxin component YwqK of YwqJK toxin-antitoxin module